jgi:hypothetical protein
MTLILFLLVWLILGGIAAWILHWSTQRDVPHGTFEWGIITVLWPLASLLLIIRATIIGWRWLTHDDTR